MGDRERGRNPSGDEALTRDAGAGEIALLFRAEISAVLQRSQSPLT